MSNPDSYDGWPDHHAPPDSIDFDWSEVGASPGTLREEVDAEASSFHVVAYGPEATETISVETVSDVQNLRETWDVVWLDVRGVGDLSTLKEVGETFGIPSLVLEDIQSHPQRTKAEYLENRLFVISHIPHWENGLEFEEVAIWVESGLVITFHEQESEIFAPIYRRIFEARGQLRSLGADYLMYAILDTVIDKHYPILEQLGDQIDELDAEIVESRETEIISRIHSAKRNIDALHHSIRPQSDMVNSLIRRDGGFIEEQTVVYLRDCYDHAIQISEIASRYHEAANGLMSLYLSLSGHRLNEVMKVLTIVGTIFIPLTFIAGIYGMNFDPAVSPYNMPELSWYWGYPASLGIMASIGIMLTVFFWRKGWIGS
jgi:magnesium transporter